MTDRELEMLLLRGMTPAQAREVIAICENEADKYDLLAASLSDITSEAATDFIAYANSSRDVADSLRIQLEQRGLKAPRFKRGPHL
jgi:hypothetical protein